MRLMRDRPEISVVNDQHGSPTWAADLASFIMHVIGYDNWQPGVYNFSNDGNITWYDFANEIKKLISADCKINPIEKIIKDENEKNETFDKNKELTYDQALKRFAFILF